MEHYIDLHTHSNASDGSDSPEALIAIAAQSGLKAVAITDHDTFGVWGAFDAAEKYGIEFIPGIEVSISYPPAAFKNIKDEGIHIVGLFINPLEEKMAYLLKDVIEERNFRNESIAKAMREDGIPIFIEELNKENPGAVIGRPHFAGKLVSLGLADSIKDAFGKYLNNGCKYYRKREYIEKRKCFDTIISAGGIPVIAHPLQYRYSEDEFAKFIGDMKELGAAGMECIYTGYSREQTEFLKKTADSFGLLHSGGSDYHGLRKSITLEDSAKTLRIPYDYLEKLKEKAGR